MVDMSMMVAAISGPMTALLVVLGIVVLVVLLLLGYWLFN